MPKARWIEVELSRPNKQESVDTCPEPQVRAAAQIPTDILGKRNALPHALFEGR